MKLEDLVPQDGQRPDARPRDIREGYVEFDGTNGTISSHIQPEPAENFDGILVQLGLDPDQVEIVGNPSVRSWDGPSGARLYHYKATIRTKAAAGPSLPNLDRLVKRAKPVKKPKRGTGPASALVVAFADPQVGKVDHRGGSEALVERVSQTFDVLEEHLRRIKPALVLWSDVGDIVEEFNSAGGPLAQATSNDLSLMQQIELAAAIEHAGIALCAKHADEVIVAGVGSNHCRWRSGKADLGRPPDDWGLHILRLLQARYADNPALSHVRFVLPEAFTEHVLVNVLDTYVGVVHGHQARRGELLGEWWAKQAHGGSSLADADLLLAGHFHNWQTYPSGRSAVTGREKRVHIAPTLDNGSSWYRNGPGGSDSDPGLLVMTIEEGTGVIDQRVLRPGRWQ